MLTRKDIVYRNNAANVKAIISVDDDMRLSHIDESISESPSVEIKIHCGKTDKSGWTIFDEGLNNAPKFIRPTHVNNNDDAMLLYFTSAQRVSQNGDSQLCISTRHIVTAKYWHNLHENSLHLTVADTGWGKAVWGNYMVK